MRGRIVCTVYTQGGVYDLTYDEWFSFDESLLHRSDGPAVEWSDGKKEWWVKGKLHRLEGPAVIESDDTKEWWVKGKRHRLDGPAIEMPDGLQMWYIYDKQLNRIEVEKWIKENNIDLSTKADRVAFKICFS